MSHGLKLRTGAGAVMAVVVWTLSVAIVLATSAPAGAATHGVAMVDLTFSPKTISVQPGDTVVWTNNSGFTHTVTADDGSFNSGSLGPGQSFSHTFAVSATVAYHCSIHGAPGGIGMAGTVVVGAAPTPTTAPPVTTPASAPPATSPASPGLPVAPTPSSAPSVSPGAGAAAGATSDPTQLPHTGSNAAALAALAAALLVLGSAVVASARRRTA